jgi:hypothetical protein
MIMTAYVANKTLTVHGADACGDWRDAESVDWFHTNPQGPFTLPRPRS